MSDVLKAAEAELAALCPPTAAIPLGPMSPVVEGGFTGMNKSDWVVCGTRERIGAVLRGAKPERLIDPNQGARPYKLAPVSDAPGTRALHAVGLALGAGAPVLCILGSASAASGSFAEAMNTAALTGAHVIFLLATTPIEDDAPVGRQLAGDPIELAKAHGLSAVSVAAKTKDIKAAVAKARKGDGPALIHVQLEL